jgi:hypothetical protein
VDKIEEITAICLQPFFHLARNATLLGEDLVSDWLRHLDYFWFALQAKVPISDVELERWGVLGADLLSSGDPSTSTEQLP